MKVRVNYTRTNGKLRRIVLIFDVEKYEEKFNKLVNTESSIIIDLPDKEVKELMNFPPHNIKHFPYFYYILFLDGAPSWEHFNQDIREAWDNPFFSPHIKEWIRQQELTLEHLLN